MNAFVSSLLAALVLLSGSTDDVSAVTATLTNLYSFTGSPSDGANPRGPLVEGADGNFYGTTLQGGTLSFGTGMGTVFKISTNGVLTILHQFGGFPMDGQNPYGGLVVGSDSNFYGLATSGGPTAAGTVFRLTPDGSLTNLHSLVADTEGSGPESELLLGSDGNFYGTTTGGGAGRSGTVFRVSSDGSLTNLHSFISSSTEGGILFAGLVEGSDSNFYGVTYAGGAGKSGTVFQITPSGTVTTLHSFHGSDGNWPIGRLVQGSDGNFYGTTVGGGGGGGGGGTVFRISSSGTFTTLHSFHGTDGAAPFAGLIEGSDGNFYGTTDGGGSGTVSGGTVYQITPSGTLTTLYSFTGGADGRGSLAPLVLGSDGNYYGTTYHGGASGNCALGCGTVFKLVVTTNQFTVLALVTPNGGEIFASGEVAPIQWQAPPTATHFNLQYSINNGLTWKTITNGVTGSSFDWTVPPQTGNKTKSKVRVIAFDASNKKLGTDPSAGPFTIEVVKLSAPNGGETLTGGAVQTIMWDTHETIHPVASVKLLATLNGGVSYKAITNLTVNAGTFDWTVPTVTAAQTKCKLKVLLKSDTGLSIGADLSDHFFTIAP